MNAYEKLLELEDKTFKLITGVTKDVFEKMLNVLKREYAKEHAQGGQPGLIVELRLAYALEYWREYRSIRHMANDHQVAKSVISRAIIWTEDVLSKSPEFELKELKERFKPGEENEVPVMTILIDVEEQPIERPKYKQEDSYSGKKTTYYEIPSCSRYAEL